MRMLSLRWNLVSALSLLLIFANLQFVYAVRPDSTSSLETLLAMLEQRVTQLEARLNDKEDAQILLFRDRNVCPDGYKPMENAFGRTIVLGADSRGSVTTHSITDKTTLDLPCSNVIGVAESGFHRVCNINNGNSTALSVDVRNLIPHVVLFPCAKMDPSRPVVP